MEALVDWVKEVGELVVFLGLIKIGYNWLWRAFSGKGNIM